MEPRDPIEMYTDDYVDTLMSPGSSFSTRDLADILKMLIAEVRKLKGVEDE